MSDVLVPSEIESAITTPHEHENADHHRPVWILWKMIEGADGIPYPPVLDCICDSEDMARCHYQMMVDSERLTPKRAHKFWVERIPVNHRFASSLSSAIEVHALKTWKAARNFYKRPGD